MLESWSKHQVYEEIDDTGQDCISVQWVVTPKMIDGLQKMKARLCARGFEESAKFRTDSPTSIEREVYLRPPVECKTLKIWRLKKTVYGLADAPRVWYLRLKEELLKLGVTSSTYDQGLFYWHSLKGLEGILVCFVDDLLWVDHKTLRSISL